MLVIPSKARNPLSGLKNPYSQKAPLVAQGFINIPQPYSLIFKYCPENKGIRLEEVDVALATKGALEDKGLVDIQNYELRNNN